VNLAKVFHAVRGGDAIGVQFHADDLRLRKHLCQSKAGRAVTAAKVQQALACERFLREIAEELAL
jgi:hypothetical protein